MGRSTRMVVPGQALLISQRGNNRQPVFFSDRDCKRYIDVLDDAARAFGVAIHAYALMTDRVYLLVTPRDRVGPSRMMQSVGRQYVRYVNDVYGRSGTLWDGRYRSCLVDTEKYLMLCGRYIETEPIRAGMVVEPRAYRWTSYRHNALGVHEELITEHTMYLELGDTKARRLAAYRSLFEAPLSPDEIDAVRLAAETGAVLGDRGFRDEMESMLNQRLTRNRHGGDRKSQAFRGRQGEASM